MRTTDQSQLRKGHLHTPGWIGQAWMVGLKGGTGSGLDSAVAPCGLSSLLLLCSFSTVASGQQLCSRTCRCMRLSALVASYWKAWAGAQRSSCWGLQGRRPRLVAPRLVGQRGFGSNNESTLRALTGGGWPVGSNWRSRCCWSPLSVVKSVV